MDISREEDREEEGEEEQVAGISVNNLQDKFYVLPSSNGNGAQPVRL